MRKNLRIAALLAVLTIVAAACGGGDSGEGGGGGGGGGGSEIPRGGTIRIAIPAPSDFLNGMDPQKEYYQLSWLVMGRLMSRALYGYPGLPADEGGSTPQLDAAESVEVSDDGLTWTFTIKEGVAFGNPLNRPVTAQDFVNAFQRLADPETGSGWAFYYSPVIAGWDEAGGEPVSGIKAIDDRTIEFTLNEPYGGLPYLLAMPGTAPLPTELVEAHGDDYDSAFGSFLVSTGPYEWEGYEDIAILEGDTPPSGMQFGTGYILVRNASYDPATDDLRENYLDRFEISVGGEGQELNDQVVRGDLDFAFEQVSAQTLATIQTDPELAARWYQNPGSSVGYQMINVYEPPLDDVHIRKALNYIWPKAALRQLIGGESAGPYATHFISPTLLGGIGEDYQPYATPKGCTGDACTFEGDLEAAKAEMALSKYDANKDGLCDDPACDEVPWIVFESADPVVAQTRQLIVETVAGIGLNLKVVPLDYTTLIGKCSQPEGHVSMCSGGWLKDFSSAYTFFQPLLNECVGNNYTNVGCDPAVLEAAGYTEPEGGWWSIDSRIKDCEALAAGSQEQLECYHELDIYVMETIVPLIPGLFGAYSDIVSANVANVVWDDFAESFALDKFAVYPSGGSA